MPAKFQPKLQQNSDMTMKVMSAASYLTYGIAGLIYVIANGRYSKNMFFRFHFVQAILLSIFNTFIAWTGSALGNTLGGILGLFGPGAAGASGAIGTGLGLVMQGVQLIYLLAVIAGVVQSMRGKYLEIPGVSKLVRSNTR
ncbi:MAG: hypothetical protein Q8T09_16110 [Candidatus Melainabacteria bacterium]|nr:hypothetical protein [Candidatus Melainabacteria bacterium]